MQNWNPGQQKWPMDPGGLYCPSGGGCLRRGPYGTGLEIRVPNGDDLLIIIIIHRSACGA